MPSSKKISSAENCTVDGTEIWNYTTPSGQAAVVSVVYGDDYDHTYIVVLAYWWEANEEASDEEICANSIGTLTEVAIPEDDESNITGVFTAAMPE